jgi:hypothetical protein
MKGVCRACGTTDNLTAQGNECKVCNRARQKKYRIAKGAVPYTDRPMVCKVCGTDKNLSIVNGKAKRICLVHAAELQRNQRAKPDSQHKEKHREYRKRLRLEILAAYGNQCNVCGQRQEAYLEIDHINGGGNIHRKTKGQEGVYSDIKNRGFPKDEFQVLCANCHLAKTRGYDPAELL